MPPADAAGPLREAAERHAQGDLLQAERLARHALVIAPCAAGWLLLGRVLLDQGHADEAAGVLRHGLLAHGDATEAPAMAAGLSRCLLAQGRGDEAASLVDAARKLWPQDAGLRLQSGWLALAARDAARAVAVARDALSDDGNDAPAWRLLGEARLARGETAEAGEALARAQALAPADDGVRMLRAAMHRERGDRAGARRLAAEILERNPGHAGARRLLAQVMLDEGSPDAARALLLRHLVEQRADAQALCLLAEAQGRLGRRAQALRTVQRALAIDAGLLDALRLRTRFALEAQDTAGALQGLEQVLAIDRESPATALLAARVLSVAKRHREALDCARAAAMAVPGDAQAWRVLADAHLRAGHPADAVDAAEQALRLAAEDPANLRVAAYAYSAVGRPNEARRALQLAMNRDPDPGLHYDLAHACRQAGDIDAARTHAETVLAARPWPAEILLYAQVLVAAGDPRAGVACAAALRASPRGEGAIRLALLAAAQGIPQTRRLAALVPASLLRAAYRDVVLDATHRLGHATMQAVVRHAMEDVSEDPWLELAALYAAGMADGAHRTLLAHQARAAARSLRLGAGTNTIATAWHRSPGARKPRIGYLAGQPHQSLLRRVLAAHDAVAADVFVYTNEPPSGLPPHVRVRPLDERLDHHCAADGIDVAIDAGGLHPFVGQFDVLRHVARRLAPVQLAWLGQVGPGGGLFDGAITDDVVVPVAHETEHDEAVYRLEGGQWCWDPPPFAPAVAAPPVVANGFVTFASVARGLRVGPACVAAWARVLAAVPASRLRLMGLWPDDMAQRRELLAGFASHGIDASRLSFERFLPPGRFQAALADADVVLDSLPASGGLSLLDALWMGLPVVTCAGEWAGARQGASILRSMGRGEWVADSVDGFVAIASRLAADVPALSQARAGQRALMAASPLFDGRRVAAGIEALARKLVLTLPSPAPRHAGRVHALAQWRLDRRLEGPAAIVMPSVTGVPDVSVVVSVRRHAGLTWGALQALADQRGVAFEVLIADEAGVVHAAHLHWRLHHAHAMQGVGADVAAACATGRHIAFLEGDAQLQPGALAAAVKALDADASLGAVGGRVVRADGLLQEAGVRVGAGGRATAIGEGEDPGASAARAARPADAVSGAFLVTPAAVWKRFEGLDDAIAYCGRVWGGGLRVELRPEAVVVRTSWEEGAAAARVPLDSDRWASPGDARDRRPRVLFIENEVPHESRGAGLPRARLMLQSLAGWPVTLYPAWNLEDDWRAVYATVPASVEVALGQGLHGLESFLERRKGVYDVLLVSRPTNLARIEPLRRARPDLFEGLRLVYDAEALFALRENLQADVVGPPMTQEAKDTRLRDELALADGASDVFVVSDIDAAHFRGAGHRAHVLAHSAPPRRSAPGPGAREGLLFVGIVHPDTPNEDGLLWLAQEVLPRVRAKLGFDPVLHVVGACHSPRVAALESATFRLLGAQQDLQPHYDAARVFVAPARYAGGVPAKVIEAAAGGIPCVASDLLVRQLGWQDGRDILGAADPEAFAGGIVRLLYDDGLWTAVQSAAWAEGERRYDPAVFARTLRDVLSAG